MVSTTVVAAPCNSLLAERTLIMAGAVEDRPFELGRWLKVSAKMLFVGLMKSMVFLFFGILIFVCSFIPILNFVSSFAAFLIMAFDSSDYSFEIMEMSLRERFRFFQNHFPEFAGMASFLGLTVFVPGTTLLLLPFSVVGAALTLSDLKKGS